MMEALTCVTDIDIDIYAMCIIHNILMLRKNLSIGLALSTLEIYN
jgi:hypothetical protein